MKNVLLLGPGTSRHRFGSQPFGTDQTERLTVVDYNPSVEKAWPEARFCWHDLRTLIIDPLPLEADSFDEIHAYEVLNLLGGNEVDFFAVWRELWRVLKPGSILTATVPHWRSEYIHSYPAPQRTYTPALLSYLDPEWKLEAKSDFTGLWPKPHRFARVSFVEIGAPTPHAFCFKLRKEHTK